MRLQILSSILFISILSFHACKVMDTAPDPEMVLISPIESLSDDELRMHMDGDAVFNRSFTREDGVGPVFIATTCRSCHFNGGKGHPFNEIVRFGEWNTEGKFDEMLDKSGPQLQYRSIDGYPAEEVPEAADGVVHLNPPALAGLGFLEALSEEDILSWEDVDDTDGDGISGRAPYVYPPHYALDHTFILDEPLVNADGTMLGRFGKKSFSVNLFQQAARALNEDLGMTTSAENHDPFNWKATPEQIEEGDGVPNPEISDAMLDQLTFFLRSCAPPPRRNANSPAVLEGEAIFAEIGCVKCHRPSFTTAKSRIDALSEKLVFPYSDMLLHDMGDGLDDGYTEGDAQTFEWRTPPLWGLGLAEESQGGTGYYMHDGRATTLYDAIQAHGGEAASIKGNFNALEQTDQQYLIEFLRSL